MPESRRLTSATGEVSVEHSLFQLDDIAAVPTGDPDDEAPVPHAPDLVAVGVNAARFRSEIGDNYPLVTIESWSAEPPEPPDRWEQRQEVRLHVDGGRLRFHSLVSRIPGPEAIDVTPGSYQMRVWCRGRLEARSRLMHGELLPHGVEQWLVQVWPE